MTVADHDIYEQARQAYINDSNTRIVVDRSVGIIEMRRGGLTEDQRLIATQAAAMALFVDKEL